MLYAEQEIRRRIENGQVESAVWYIQDEPKEHHDKLFEYAVKVSMKNELFKGARRAAGHLSEAKKEEVVLGMIGQHQYGFGYHPGLGHHEKYFFTAWLETIKLLKKENQRSHIIGFIGFIAGKYCFSQTLVRQLRNAFNLLSEPDKKSYVSELFKNVKGCVLDNTRHNALLFFIQIINDELKDAFVCLVLRTIMQCSEKKWTYENVSLFADVVSETKNSETFFDPQLFKLARQHITQISLGNSQYSGKEFIQMLAKFMPEKRAKEFLYYQ